MAVSKNNKTGKWYSKFRFRDYAGNAIQKKKEGFATKHEAQAWETDYRKQHEGKERLTFAQAWVRYIADCEKRLKAGSVRQKQVNYKVFRPFYDTPIAEITTAMVRQWQNEVLLAANKENGKLKYAARTIKNINTTLSSFFGYCVKFCGLDKNPVLGAGVITIRAKDEKPARLTDIWQKAQFNTFLQYIERQDLRLIYSILFWCGLRRGECLGLRVKDVDIANRIMHIRQSRFRHEIDLPKTKSSLRDIKIPQIIIDMMKEYLKHLYIESKNDLLFPNVNTWTLDNSFGPTQEQAGIKPRIRLHDLRHSHASMLIHLGFSPQAVADRLGHANAAMVLSIYGHMYPQVRTEVVDAIDKIAAE